METGTALITRVTVCAPFPVWVLVTGGMISAALGTAVGHLREAGGTEDDESAQDLM